MPERLLVGKNTLDVGGSSGLGQEFILSDYVGVDGVATKATVYFFGGSPSYGFLFTVYAGDTFRDDNASLESEVEFTCVTGWCEAALPSPLDTSASKYYRLGGNGYWIARNTIVDATTGLTFLTVSPIYPNWTPPSAPGTMGTWHYQGYFGLLGWIPPDITSIDNDTLIPGQSRTIQGTDFMDSGDIATVWVADGPVFATAAKVEQTLTAQSDDEITFGVVGGLLGDVYLFVETDLGQVNETGLQITVAPSGFRLPNGVIGNGVIGNGVIGNGVINIP